MKKLILITLSCIPLCSCMGLFSGVKATVITDHGRFTTDGSGAIDGEFIIDLTSGK